MRISITSFQDEKQAIRQVREAVFVKEQGIPYEDEFDAQDETCEHAVAWNKSQPVGTGRLGQGGRIGRIAILKQARGKGVALAIMLALEQEARELGYNQLWAHAQVQALGFYEKAGYSSEGEQFIEDGIPHKRISKQIQSTGTSDV